ncbi:MAG: tetratricopeptide repeat protein [Myxococcota bacterium]
MLENPRHRSIFLAGLALLAICLGAAGCGGSDPLEPIRQQQASGDFAGSLEPLRELLKERGDDAEVQYLYGRALSMTGQPSLAEWSLDEAMKDEDWVVPAGSQLAVGQLRAGNYDLAAETAGKVLEVDPENLDMLILRANAYAHSNRNEEQALADVERIEALDPENLEAMEPKILALFGLERYEEAGEAIEELGKRIDASGANEQLEGWHCATATLYAFESGEIDAAKEGWADCTERFPTHGNVIENAVAFYDGQRDFERSLEVLRRAHEEMPESRDYRLNLTDRLRSMGKVEEAQALLEEAAADDENPLMQTMAWIDLGQHYHALEEYEKAADAAQEALDIARQLGPPNPQLLFQYADAQLIAGRLDEAWAATEEMTVVPQREMIRGRIAQERGDLRESLEHFDAAFELWPDNAFGRYYAAIVAEQLGEFDRAIESYRYAIRLAMDQTDAKVRLAHILVAEGKPRDALETVKHQGLGEATPVGVDAELLAIELWARLRLEDQVRKALAGWQARRPRDLGRAVAAAATGYASWGGPAAAARVVRGAANEGLDLSDPQHAVALRLLVESSESASERAAAGKAVTRALAKAPESADFQQIHGLWLEGAGRAGEAREAYGRALSIEAEHAGALAGRGRLASESDPEQAVADFDRAFAADDQRVDAMRDAAAVLAAAGRSEEAQERLRRALAVRSYDAAAATARAERQRAAGEAGDATLDLARRAARFGGGPEGHELLSRVHEARGEAEDARVAAARADEIRARQAGG